MTGIGATSSNGNAFKFRFVVASARPTTQNPTFSAAFSISEEGLFSLDVSSLFAGYVGIWITTNNYQPTTLTVSEIWGEKAPSASAQIAAYEAALTEIETALGVTT